MKLGLIVCGLLFVGCVSGSVDEPQVCDTKSMQFVSPVQVSSPLQETISTTKSLDFSKQIHDLSDYGTLSITSMSNSLSITGSDFEWLDHLSMSLASDGNQPLQLLDYNLTDADKHSSNLSLQMTNLDKAIDYVSGSNAQLTIQATGTFTSTITDFSNTLCVGVHADVHKSL